MCFHQKQPKRPVSSLLFHLQLRLSHGHVRLVLQPQRGPPLERVARRPHERRDRAGGGGAHGVGPGGGRVLQAVGGDDDGEVGGGHSKNRGNGGADGGTGPLSLAKKKERDARARRSLTAHSHTHTHTVGPSARGDARPPSRAARASCFSLLRRPRPSCRTRSTTPWPAWTRCRARRPRRLGSSPR